MASRQNEFLGSAAEILGLENPEFQKLTRDQKLAELLIAQGLKQPDGQMISGRYVAPSWSQRLAPLLSTQLGISLGDKVTEDKTKMAALIRDKRQKLGNEFLDALNPTQTELAGPTPTGQALTTVNQPNMRAAIQAASDPQAPEFIRAQLAEMLKTQKVGKGERIYRPNLATGQNELVAQGPEEYRAPIQFDDGRKIQLLDPNDPTKVLREATKYREPKANQVLTTDDGTFMLNTTTGQAVPVLGPDGKPMTGSGKPLTEVQSKSVAFGLRAMSANAILNELEDQGFTNKGVIRTAAAGVVDKLPVVGEKLGEGVMSTFNILPGALGGPSSQQQQVDQGRRNFISAVLRKESGAVISPTEYAAEERKYFPQTGDSPEVIAQKRNAREEAVLALQAEAGARGTRQMSEALSQRTNPPASGGARVVDFNSLK